MAGAQYVAAVIHVKTLSSHGYPELVMNSCLCQVPVRWGLTPHRIVTLTCCMVDHCATVATQQHTFLSWSAYSEALGGLAAAEGRPASRPFLASLACFLACPGDSGTSLATDPCSEHPLPSHLMHPLLLMHTPMTQWHANFHNMLQ